MVVGLVRVLIFLQKRVSQKGAPGRSAGRGVLEDGRKGVFGRGEVGDVRELRILGEVWDLRILCVWRYF